MSTQTVSEFLAANRPPAFTNRPAVILGDGTEISIQASARHYCEPRENDADAYELVEVFVFQGWDAPTLADWIEPYSGEKNYAFVPLDLLEAEVTRRGGIAPIK